MKTSELTGAALNWAVAKCEGVKVTRYPESPSLFFDAGFNKFNPSIDWAQGGPIIERELSDLVIQQDRPDYDGRVHAYINSGKPTEICCWGNTILIAAMRCFVASKLGDEIEIPKELV